MPSSIDSFQWALKRWYTPGRVYNQTIVKKPILGNIKKDTSLEGEAWIVPMTTVNGQGTSAGSLANAQTASSNLGGDRWIITLAEMNSSTKIGDRVIKASRGNPGAYFKNAQAEIDSILETHSARIQQKIWGNGGGSRGRIAAINGNTLTLDTPQDIINFERNMILQACQDDGTNAGTTPRTGSATVTALDRSNGLVTVNNAAAINSLTVGDFLFALGDVVANTGLTPTTGIRAYLTGATTPGVLWGVTRTADIQRYAGAYLPQSAVNGLPISERFRRLGAYMGGRFQAMGAGSYQAYLHPEDFDILLNEAQAKVMQSADENDTKFGFDSVQIWLGGSKVKVYTDPFVPKGIGVLLNMEHWLLGSMGQLVQPVNEDGLTLLRSATTNDYEARYVSYYNITCKAPGNSGLVSLA